MFRNMRLSTFNLVNSLIISVLFLLLWTFNILQERDKVRARTDAFAREHVSSQKELLSFIVANAIDFIRFKQSQIEQRIKEDLQTRVDEAHRIAEKLYTANRGRLSDAEIQRDILLALDSLRFNEGRGYYFVYTLDGRELLSWEQYGSESRPSTANQRIISNMARIATEQGQGFHSYDYPKPGVPSGSYPKISFVRKFEPYGWFIGTGEYVEDMKTRVQQEAIQWIDHLRFSEVGYLWIQTTELGMVVHPFYTRDRYPHLYNPEGLQEYTDVAGKRLFVEMRDRCLEDGSGYIEYHWPKPNRSGHFEKLSYVELIADWGWIVGAGVYVDDMERAIRQNELMNDRRIRSEIRQLLILAASLIIALLALTRIFHQRIRKAFAIFSDHFRQAAQARRQIDHTRLDFVEFKRLAVYVNKMVEDQRAALAELKKSEERLMQAQKMEAIGRLGGGIAHDFGNLMMVVHGYTEMLLWSPDLPEGVQAALEEIQHASGRACSLTHKLLAFSRRQILQPEIINLNRLVADLKGILDRIIGEDIRLLTAFGEEPHFVEADPVQIEQIIINLALNARDAMPRGGVLRISMSKVDGEQHIGEKEDSVNGASCVLLEISDTGSGMDADTLDHLFEPFFTTKATGKGTGLGLSTVYGIVKQSGGNIVVSSKPSGGTTFSVYLPRVYKQAPEQAVPDRHPQPQADGETVLLVEDDEKVRDMIGSTLRRVGFRVVEASDGTEALTLLRTQAYRRIDLILTDMIMPAMGGDELVDRLPSHYRDTPVLFMSGYPGTRNIGNRPYLQKPFSTQTLSAKVRELLEAGKSAGARCRRP